MIRPPTRSKRTTHSFPTRRSSDLQFRARAANESVRRRRGDRRLIRPTPLGATILILSQHGSGGKNIGKAHCHARNTMIAGRSLPGTRLPKPPRRSPKNGNGRIAQLVEQLTLNQRVLGSSPSASTIFSNNLAPILRGSQIGRAHV